MITGLPPLARRNRRLNPRLLPRPPTTVTNRRSSHQPIARLDGSAGQQARHASGWLWGAHSCNRS